MNTLQTLEMALEALEHSHAREPIWKGPIRDAIAALRTQIALEKMAENERELGIQMHPDEPVSWRTPNWGHGPDEWVYFDADDRPNSVSGPTGEPLYTRPPQRKPLTDEQIFEVARDHYTAHQRAEISFARAIEAAHGITGEQT